MGKYLEKLMDDGGRFSKLCLYRPNLVPTSVSSDMVICHDNGLFQHQRGVRSGEHLTKGNVDPAFRQKRG